MIFWGKIHKSNNKKNQKEHEEEDENQVEDEVEEDEDEEGEEGEEGDNRLDGEGTKRIKQCVSVAEFERLKRPQNWIRENLPAARHSGC